MCVCVYSNTYLIKVPFISVGDCWRKLCTLVTRLGESCRWTWDLTCVISKWLLDPSWERLPSERYLLFFYVLSPFKVSLCLTLSVFFHSVYIYVTLVVSSCIFNFHLHILMPTFCLGLFPKCISIPISLSGFGGTSPPSSPCRAAVSERGSSPEHRDAQTAVRTRAANTPLWTGGRGQSHAGWARLIINTHSASKVRTVLSPTKIEMWGCV